MHKKRLNNTERQVQQQRQKRLSMLMAQAYRKRDEFLKTHNKHTRQAAGLHSIEGTARQKRPNLFYEESKFLMNLFHSLEQSIEKQDNIIESIYESIYRNSNTRRPAVTMRIRQHVAPHLTLLTHVFSITVTLLLLRALLINLCFATPSIM